jgi:WD40 repeat protein/uncharacterized caspase-like protein
MNHTQYYWQIVDTLRHSLKWRLVLLYTLTIFINARAQKPDIVISAGHTDMISAITMSTDGKWIATSSIDKSLKIIDANTGMELRTIGGHNQRLNGVKFDPTNRYISGHVESESIVVYDVVTGNLVANYPCNQSDYYFLEEPNTLVYIDDQSNLKVVNSLTGAVLFATEQRFLVNLAQHAIHKNWIYAYTAKGELLAIDVSTGKNLLTVQLFEEYRFATCPMQCSNDGKYLAMATDGAVNGKDGQIHIISTANLKKIGTLKIGESRIVDFCFDARKPIISATEHNGNTVIFDVVKMKEINRFRLTDTFSAYAIGAHPTEDILLVGEIDKIHLVDRNTGKRLKTFEALGKKILSMGYDQKGKYLVTNTRDLQLKIWDLEQNKIINSFMGFFPVAFSPNGQEFVSMHNAIELVLREASTGDKKRTLNTEGELIQNVAFNKDGSLLSGAGFGGIIRIWDVHSGNIKQRLSGHQGGIYATDFHPIHPWLVSVGMDNITRIWDLTTGNEIKQLTGHEIVTSQARFSPDGQWLATAAWDKTIRIYATQSWELVHTLIGHTNMITTIDFTGDSRFLASGAGNNSVWEADNSVIVWDVTSGKEHCRFKGHTGTIQKIICDRIAPHIFSTGDDGTVKVWNYKTCEEIVTMINVGIDDYALITPDHYYMASRNALSAISFRIGAELYPFEQFDLKFNRPDIVCSRLGKTPQGLINAYEYLYQKRLRQNNFTEEQLGDDFSLPKLTITTRNLPMTTEQKEIELDVSIKDEHGLLHRINVYVNDVPIYGTKGISLAEYATQSISYQLTIQLVPGVNRVQVSAHNSRGVESLKSTFTTVYNNELVKGNLYLVTIGVDEYQESGFNLKYPVKDCNDVVKSFAADGKNYRMIYINSLYNKDVTVENVARIADFLSDATIDDVVIFFLAGHGLLNETYDYYFATYDVDFAQPALRGVPYEKIEQLLANVKAYRKLLFMDTCHSGELDKTEVEESENEAIRVGDVQFRSVGSSISVKQAFGAANLNEMMESLFTDVRKGTGATIISSAGGAEFAMESDTWKNGLFTYCLLKGLNQKTADSNGDGVVTVSEIRSYVYREVTSLSRGKQRPTARSENLSVDFVVK